MSIDFIFEVLPPPISPSENNGNGKWTNIESHLGTILPDDYKEYIAIYGSGCIGEFIWPFNPFSKNEHLNLINQVNIRIDALNTLRDQFEIKIPYPLHPQEGGLLPWAATDNGDVLFWLKEGNPENWTIVINEARVEYYEHFETSMTGFIYKLLSKEILSSIIPTDFIDYQQVFRSL